MTDPIASTPPPSASLVAKASLLTGRAIDRPFEVPGQMTESAYNAGGVAHGLVGRLTGAVLDGVSALKPRGFIEKLISKSSDRLDATLAHNQSRAETSKNVFWDPVSTGAHQIGQAFANPFSLFYAKRAGFEIPTEPEALRDMLAKQITDPEPHVRFPTPPPAEPEPAPDPAPTPTPEEPGTPTPTPDDPGKPVPTPEEPGTPVPTPEEPGTPTPTPEEPGTPVPTPEEPGTPTPTPEEPGTPPPTPGEPGAPTPTPEDPATDPAKDPDGETPTTPTGDGETTTELPKTAPDDAAGTTPPAEDGAAPSDDAAKPDDATGTDDAAKPDAEAPADDASKGGTATGSGAAGQPQVAPDAKVMSQTLGLQPHPTNPITQPHVEGAPSPGPIIQSGSDDAAKVMSAAIDAVDAPQRQAPAPIIDEAAPIASGTTAAAASLDAEAGARAVAAPTVVDEPVGTVAPAPRNVPAPTAPPMRTR